MKNKIIVPTDLTNAAGQAIRQATAIASKTHKDLVLLHVLNEKSPVLEEVRKQLGEEVVAFEKSTGQHAEYIIKEGNIFEEIPFVACEHDYDLMVIGTHGVQGIKQMLFGANILKLVAKIPMPVLVVQEDSPLKEDFHKIVLPVSSHDTFGNAVDALIPFTASYNSEIHLYSIHKAGFDWPDQMLKNIEMATQAFEKNGVKMVRVKEDQTVYSMGYAKQTLKYGESSGADLICIIPGSSKEYYYIAPADKEALLLNEQRIPVLCAGGACTGD
jgi:nucleotide-binding universal stress UspA family protein